MSRGKAAGQDCLGRGSPNLPLYLCRKQQLGGEAEGPSILVLEGGVSSERKPPCTSALKLEGSPPRGRAWDCSQGSSPLCGGSDVSGCTGASSALARCGRSPSSSGVAWRGVARRTFPASQHAAPGGAALCGARILQPGARLLSSGCCPSEGSALPPSC